MDISVQELFSTPSMGKHAPVTSVIPTGVKNIIRFSLSECSGHVDIQK